VALQASRSPAQAAHGPDQGTHLRAARRQRILGDHATDRVLTEYRLRGTEYGNAGADARNPLWRCCPVSPYAGMRSPASGSITPSLIPWRSAEPRSTKAINGLVATVRHARISGNVQSRLAFPLIMSTSSHQSARTDATAYPWGWLGVLGTVIVMMITGAGWLYQKNGEWPVPATQDPRNAAHEQTPAAAATPSAQNSVAERVKNPSDVASPPSLSTPSTPPIRLLKNSIYDAR
jgi:hypothetical protein